MLCCELIYLLSSGIKPKCTLQHVGLSFFRVLQTSLYLNSRLLLAKRFEGHAVPFGALSHCKPKPESLGSHEPLTKAGLFIGYDLGPGLRWTQIYRFLDYESLQKGVFQEVTSREIVVPLGPRQFPLAEAWDEAMAVSET